MRAFRTILGVFLMIVSVAALAVAAAGWTAHRHAGPGGSYTATLSSVHSTGYAVTVPDVPAVLDRHVAARLLGSDRARITVSAATAPLVLWLVPADELARYLDGVARTELSGVGFAAGPQPVRLTDVAGTGAPEPLIQQAFWTRAPSGQSLEWDRTTDSRTAVLLVRADGLPDFAATLTVAVYPSWLDQAIWIAIFTAAAALAAATALLFRRHRRPLALADRDRDRVLEFAELVAQRLRADRVIADASASRELTGEFRQIPAARDPATESPYVHSAT